MTAEALFQEGRALLEAGKYREACGKLAESHRLDPATGTLIALAACHEGEGKLASAWAEFSDARGRAKAEGRADREELARERSEALRARLSTLRIEVGAEVLGTNGLEIRRDGVVLGQGVFNLHVPIDGGEHVIEAAAPGKSPWTRRVTVKPEHDRVLVSVPVLAAAPNAAPTAPAPEPAGEASKPWGTLEWAGVGTAGVGVVALAVGGVFLGQALGKKSDSEADCDGNSCGPVGLQQREDAVGAGNVASVFGIVGVVFVGAGAAMFVVGRSSSTEAVPGPNATLSVSFGAGALSADLKGTF